MMSSIRWITSAFRALSAIALAAAMLITCADVAGRALGHPILGAVEVGVLLAALVLAFSLPHTEQEKGHVGVELLIMRLGPRARSAMDGFNAAVGAALSGTIGWMCSTYAASMKASGEVSMTLQIPLHPIIYVISACFWALALVQLSNALQNARKVLSP